jgi:hypothetical protein
MQGFKSRRLAQRKDPGWTLIESMYGVAAQFRPDRPDGHPAAFLPSRLDAPGAAPVRGVRLAHRAVVGPLHGSTADTHGEKGQAVRGVPDEAFSIPYLLDRRASNMFEAIATSVATVRLTLRPMALWAALVVFLAVLGMVPGTIGLVVTLPLVAYATWHAYRDVVRFD